MPAVKDQILLFLKTPAKRPERKRIFSETLFLSAYTFLFLLMFQPFGTFEYAHPYKILQLAGYGLLVIFFYPLLKILVLELFFRKPKAYSLGSELLVFLLVLLLLTSVAFLYHGWFIAQRISFSHLPVFLSYGLSIWSLPALAFIYYYRRPAGGEAVVIPPLAKSTLEIKGTNLGEQFLFNPGDIYYLKSNGNYVLVYFQKAGQLKHEMLRNTLSQVSGQLPADFIPIHRSYIVNHKNFDRLVKTEGKQLLVSRQFDIRLPVVKQYLPVLERKLKDFRSN
jgi:hypothetical protein